MRLFTIGFTRKNAERFFGLLRDSGAKRVIDVRLNNVSQLAGFAKRDDLSYFLRELCAMEYVPMPDLAPTAALLKRYQQARGEWNDYAHAFLELMKSRGIERTVLPSVIDDGCLLCSEHEPQHCHRRLVAEYFRERWDHSLEIIHLI